TLEAALTLVGNTLHMLQVPPSRVMRRLGDIRRERYTALRSVYGRDPAGSVDDTKRFREELHMVLLPPGAWAIGRSIREVREHGAEVSFTAVRRDGIVGRDPDPGMTLREELHSVVLPPGAWSVGRTIREVRDRGAEVSFTAVRRDGIVGRDPDPEMELREGDVVVLFGTPEAQEHAEAVLLAG
ncbi:MAG TPA: TrkA C-terminal domain-containing protein, partial [Steroidobacteraceae bacterium]